MREGANRVTVLVLGNPDRGDDGAALAVGEGVARGDALPEGVTLLLAGRPGPGLLDLLPSREPWVLVDVTTGGGPPGTIRRIPVDTLTPGLLPDLAVSSHGFGAGEALALALALERPLPPLVFLGIEGRRFGLGEPLSPEVQKALPELEEALRKVVADLLPLPPSADPG